PHLEGSRVRSLLADDHPEEGRLPRPVRSDHAHDATARQPEVEPLEQQPVAESLRDARCYDHLIAESLPVRDDDLRTVELLARILVQHLLVGAEAGFALRLPRARGHPHPLELTLEGLLPGRRLL